MTDIGRRAIVSIIGAGAFVFFDESYGSGTIGDTIAGAGGTTADVVLENGTIALDPATDSNDVDVTVSGEVINYGGSAATQQVEFRDQIETLGAKTVDVAGEGSSDVSFTATYVGDISESDVSLTLENGETSAFVIDVPRPDIQINSLQVIDDSGNEINEITIGSPFYVEGSAGNFGEVAGSKVYRLFGDGSELDQTTVDLGPGNSTDVSLTHTYNDGDLGLSSGESKPVDLSVNDTDVGEISIFKSAIPDSAVFSFESGDLSNWDNSVGEIITEPVNQGNYAARVDDNSFDPLYSLLGSGLNKYPAPDGTESTYAIYSEDSADHRFGWGFDSAPQSYTVGYSVAHRPANGRYELLVDGNVLDTDNTNPPTGEFEIGRITWSDNGDISVVIEDLQGNQTASLSANDNTYTSQGGVLISGRSTGSGGRTIYDSINE